MAGLVSLSQKTTAKITERVKAEKCLLCDEKMVRRGLCFRHYQVFRMLQREKGSKQEKLAFEENNIRDGKILAVHQITRIKRDNPFSDSD